MHGEDRSLVGDRINSHDQIFKEKQQSCGNDADHYKNTLHRLRIRSHDIQPALPDRLSHRDRCGIGARCSHHGKDLKDDDCNTVGCDRLRADMPQYGSLRRLSHTPERAADH